MILFNYFIVSETSLWNHACYYVLVRFTNRGILWRDLQGVHSTHAELDRNFQNFRIRIVQCGCPFGRWPDISMKRERSLKYLANALKVPSQDTSVSNLPKTENCVPQVCLRFHTTATRKPTEDDLILFLTNKESAFHGVDSIFCSQ